MTPSTTSRTPSAQDASFPNVPAGRRGARSGSLLLTGASGFLGVHLLQELLERSSLPVTCLVRATDREAGRRGLLTKLRWYFPEVDWSAHEQRLDVAVGDIGEPKLGLSPDQHAELASSVTLILNAAANVSQATTAGQFMRTNTAGVASLIELARTGRAKALHHVSTIDVRGYFAAPPSLTSFSEQALEEGQIFQNAYAESKYRAEVMLRQAFDAGLDGGVYRVGYIAPHSTTGRFQQNIQQNHVARYLRASVRLGFAPYVPQRKVPATPVDSVARAILTLMLRSETPRATYYVETPHALSQYDILRVLQAAGFRLRLMPLESFLEKAASLSDDHESVSSMAPANARHLWLAPLDAARSQRELARLGFEYPAPSSRWLGKFIAHAIEVDFLEAPPLWNAVPLVGDLF